MRAQAPSASLRSWASFINLGPADMTVAEATWVFEDVLCALEDSEDGLAAVEQATVLAAAGGHLTLLEMTSFESEGDHRSPAIGAVDAKRIIDRATRIAHEASVPCSVEVDPASPPSHVVLDWAEGRDLLTVGAPGTARFGGMFSPGVAVSAEHFLTMPLLVARATPPGQRFAERILIASDGLAGSDELVDWASSLASAHHAGVLLVHAIGFESKERRRRVEEQARRLQLDVGNPNEVRIESGNPRTMIVEAAGEAAASLVVMGSRRLKGLRAIGSVSRRVVHLGHCSVLLVPPERLHP